MSAATATGIDAARASIAKVQRQIDRLLAERASLMVTTMAELIAVGIDANVIPSHSLGSKWRHPDKLVHFTSQHGSVPDGFPQLQPLCDGYWPVGPHGFSDGTLMISHGIYRVLLIDQESILIAREPGQDEADQRDHDLAVSRLRVLARKEGMRVKVRDRAISLIDPESEGVIHTGNVVSAYALLMGIDL